MCGAWNEEMNWTMGGYSPYRMGLDDRVMDVIST